MYIFYEWTWNYGIWSNQTQEVKNDVEAERDEDLSFRIRSNIHLASTTDGKDGRWWKNSENRRTILDRHSHSLWLKSIPPVIVITIIVFRWRYWRKWRKHSESLLISTYYRLRLIYNKVVITSRRIMSQ